MNTLPEGWTRKSLGDVAEVTSGGTPDRKNDRYWEGSIPWVTTGEINFNIISVTREYITEEGLKASSAKMFSPGTVLMAMYGQGMTRGRVAILGIEGTVNQNCAAIKTNGQCEYLYLYHYLAHNYDSIRSLSHYGGVDHLNNNLVRNIILPLPPLAEQRKIAAILGAWDEAIAAAERLVAALRERKRGLMQRMLTGRVRFAEYRDQPWEEKKAGEIFQPFSRRRNEGAELLSVTQERGVVPRSMLEAKVVMPAGTTDGYKLVEPGDFIISLRSFQGGIEHSAYRGLVSPAYTVLRPALPIQQTFYKHLFKSQDFIGRLGVAIIGIRDGKQINFDDFAGIRLPYPSLDEQGDIASVLDKADEEIAAHEQHLALLRQQKRGLMQRLLTGQVRVRVDEE